MNLKVERFSGSPSEWDSFANNSENASIYHRFGWKELIESLYGHECPYLVSRDQDKRIVGILPLVRIRSSLFGHFLVSIPYVSYGGPAGSKEAIASLVAHAHELAVQSSAGLLELRSAHPLSVDLSVSHRKVTVVLPLDGGSESVLKALPAKVRSQTRRPFKEGVTVRFGKDTIDDFFRVFSSHMRDLGTPTQPKEFFTRLADLFGDDMWFGCAYLEGKPVAVGAGFRSGTEFEITWASALREYNRISANMGLYWAFIERAADSGLTRFNFGRCTPGSATHKFKLQWGAVDEQLWWYQHSESQSAGTPSPDSPKFRLATAVWKKLPVSVATAIGPRIVRYLP